MLTWKQHSMKPQNPLQEHWIAIIVSRYYLGGLVQMLIFSILVIVGWAVLFLRLVCFQIPRIPEFLKQKSEICIPSVTFMHLANFVKPYDNPSSWYAPRPLLWDQHVPEDFRFWRLWSPDWLVSAFPNSFLYQQPHSSWLKIDFWWLAHIGDLGHRPGNPSCASYGRSSPCRSQMSCCTPGRQCPVCAPSECDTWDLSENQPPHRICHNWCRSSSAALLGSQLAVTVFWMCFAQILDGTCVSSLCVSSTLTRWISRHTVHRARGHSSSECA